MRTLYLHLGPSKSGSTFLQTSFELSRSALTAAGIHYPALPDAPYAGEGAALFGNYQDLYGEVRRAAASSGDLLVSGEALPEHLEDVAGIDLLDRVRREAGFDRVACLLLLRDPVDHAASEYQQAVKHVRATLTAEAWFRGYRGPTIAVRLLRELDAMGAEVTLRGYAAVAGSLVDVAETWLGLPADRLVRPAVTRINRSLSVDELELQRALNLADPRAPFVGERMVEQLPDLEPPRLVPSRPVQQAMIDRLRADLDALNARLPVDERLSLETKEPYGDQGGSVVLSADQLRVLAGTVASSRSLRPAPSRPARVARVARRALGSRGPIRGSGVVASAVAADVRDGLSRRRRVEATLLLLAASFWRRSVPMRRWAGVLGTRTTPHSPVPEPVRLDGVEDEVSRSIRVATASLPFVASCLDQAVAGSLLLRRRGLAATVVVGLSSTDPRSSHAWLLGPSGAVLTGGVAASGFVPVTEFHRAAG